MAQVVGLACIAKWFSFILLGREFFARGPGHTSNHVHVNYHRAIVKQWRAILCLSPKAGEQTFSNSNFHPIVWTGGKDWKLEFTERKQWSLFRKMYEECYSRNLRAASIKNIPIPTVREINVGNLGTDPMPFERPMSYIKTTQEEVSRALVGGRVVYDMESEDEKWLS